MNRPRPLFPWIQKKGFPRSFRRFLPLVFFLILSLLMAPDEIQRFFEKTFSKASDPSHESLKTGFFEAIDGDSLRDPDGNKDIRLYGIDAPEYHQSCLDGAGAEYACGKKAAQHLRAFIGHQAVSCRIKARDRYGRFVAQCSVGARDLNRQMVQDGWAVAYTQFTQDYVSAEREAKREKRGLWIGSFEEPRLWRKENPRKKETF